MMWIASSIQSSEQDFCAFWSNQSVSRDQEYPTKRR